MISNGKTFVHLVNRSSGSTLVQLMTYCLPKLMSTHTNLQWSRVPISQERLKIHVLDVSLKMYNLRLQVTRIHIEAETHMRVIFVFIYWSFVGRIDHSSVDTHHRGPLMWSFLDFFVVKLHENSWTLRWAPKYGRPHFDVARLWSSCIFDAVCFAAVDSGYPDLRSNPCIPRV